MPKDQVVCLGGTWWAFVNGRLHGPWPMREYAEAGLQVEVQRETKRWPDYPKFCEITSPAGTE